MLLAIDIGNTNTVFGLFDNEKLIKSFRIGTKEFRESDEYGIILLNLFHYHNLNIQGLSGAIISCVVPSLLDTFIDVVLRYFYIEPLIVSLDVDIGIAILYNRPEEVGADRLVNAVAGFEKYRQALIIVDFGTATTFDYITAKGEYAGGVISPGISVSLNALCKNASMLPNVEIIRPEGVIGRDTVSSIQSGIFYGYGALVDGIVEKIKKEVGGSPKIIATGGLARLMMGASSVIEEVEPALTLNGLRHIYLRNQK